MSAVPKSVATYISQANPELWRVGAAIDWPSLAGPNAHVISGSSFVDVREPYGTLGNPFAIVFGDQVAQLTAAEREQIARDVNTPETVFINSVQKAASGNVAVNLTVLTPTGTEMGACAHGFLGALQTLIQAGQVATGSEVATTTTLNTAVTANITEQGEIALAFRPEASRDLEAPASKLATIFGVELGEYKNCGVLSVGSPKLTLEVSPEVFDRVQQNLRNMNYEALLDFQQESNINGIHMFCRNPSTQLPEKCIQNNAFSGKENIADRATGVSNAAQIAADPHVKVGSRVEITQYSFDGPSARLVITKAAPDKMLVGGAAALFNFKALAER